MYDNYIRLGLSILTLVVAIVSLIKVNRAYSRIKNLCYNNSTKGGDSVDVARKNIAEAIDDMKISMFDEIERLISVKNTLEKDLEKNPNNAMALAKLDEIKRLIKVASRYYEMDVI